MIKFENGKKYRYEHMDVVALFSVLNTVMIIACNKGAYVGLPVNVIGLFYDLHKGCHISNIVMRLSLIAINVFFLMRGL